MASGLFLISWLIAAYKWFILIPKVTFKPVLLLSFVGQFYSLVLPGQIAGEVVKAFRLGKSRADAETIAASVIIDKLTGLIGLLMVAELGLYESPTQLPQEILFSISALFSVFIVGLFSVKPLFFYRSLVYLIEKLTSNRPRLAGITKRIIGVLDAWRSILNKPLKLLFALFLSVLFQLNCVFYISLLAIDSGIYLPLADWCWIFGFVSIAVLLPISVGGIGVREGAFAGALSLFNVPVEKSIALSMAVFTISLLGALIGGLLELRTGKK